jgi:murein DD-endopeptidase MepM/ murein hydrolase activator NlpD
MGKRHRAFLVIPPGDSRIRYIRIRISIIVALIVICLAGIAAWFLPYDRLSVGANEQTYRRNLIEQNEKLLLKLHRSRHLYHALEGKIDSLAFRQADIEEMAELRTAADTAERHVADESRSPIQLRTHLFEQMVQFARFISWADSEPTPLSSIPMLQPIVDEFAITAGLGERRDPFTGTIKWHYGVDYAAEPETPVRATASGTVTRVENHPHWGRRVRIEHAYGFATVYAHLGSVRAGKGRKVMRGDVIGGVGSSGMSTGPHLHYEVWHYGEPVDPMEYIFPRDQVLIASTESDR